MTFNLDRKNRIGMRLTHHLAAIILGGIVLGGTFPVAASFAPEVASPAVREASVDGDFGTDTACLGLQCGLIAQQAAARAIAAAAGAKVAPTTSSPSMLPDLKSVASVEGGPSATNNPSVRAAVEPALFAVLAPVATPSGAQDLLCVDGGNLLGLGSTCNPPKQPDLGGGCVFDGRLLSLKASCSVAVVPEPGTLFLLAIGALGFAAVRRRQLQ